MGETWYLGRMAICISGWVMADREETLKKGHKIRLVLLERFSASMSIMEIPILFPEAIHFMHSDSIRNEIWAWACEIPGGSALTGKQEICGLAM